MSDEAPNGSDEMDGHIATLGAQRAALKRRLDKGVPRAQFARLHALSTLVSRAEDALRQARTRTGG